ncbi:limbic system-associated membrane protein-like [Euwallacea fornicatus]|uniref:limbic system-associated membrane protein-like n=1 Tax=Euwallacea fornicatus TaxID=995702 RepID=UPI0033901EE8
MCRMCLNVPQIPNVLKPSQGTLKTFILEGNFIDTRVSSGVMKSAVVSGALLLLPLLLDFIAAKLHVSYHIAAKSEGDTFSVMCSDKDSGFGVAWKGPKNRLIGEKSDPHTSSTLHGTQLRFKKIKKEDAGFYTCKSKSDSAQFELVVTVPIRFADTPTKVIAKEGTDKILKCEANTKFEWVIDGEPPKDKIKYKVLGDGLLITNVTLMDSERHYACKAYQLDEGRFMQKNITLTVTHPPRIYEKEVIVYGYVGGAVNLTCKVEAEPPPTFKWFQKNNRIKIIGRELRDSNPKVSVLSLILQDNKDFGEYKCEAENSEGTVQSRFSLLNGTQPSAPVAVEVRSSSPTSMVVYVEEPDITDLENKTGMRPNGILVEYRSKDDEPSYWHAQNFKLAEDKLYTVSNLTANTTYQVRAATLNPAGSSDFTNNTAYTTTSSAVILSGNMPIFLYALVTIPISLI